MDRLGTGGNGVVRGDPEATPVLVVAAGTHVCAIPLRYVGETMRPLGIEPVPGPHHFVRGISMIRGAPVPVVDLKSLLDGGDEGNVVRRFVTVRVDDRQVALAVERVVGITQIDPAQFGGLPPLLRQLDADLVESIGTSDAQLLLVLRAARLIPEDAGASLAVPAA